MADRVGITRAVGARRCASATHRRYVERELATGGYNHHNRMPLAPNSRLGPYSIVTCIGSGGMGDVYSAWDTRLERHVALKLLTEELASDDRARSRFRKEAKAIAATSHPNILAVYDAELEHAPFFLVTELLQGQTLRHTIEHSSLPWKDAVEIGAAVAEGLAAAHDVGITHRDIKPDNLFLTNSRVVKILDFGLAQFKVAAPDSHGSWASTVSDANLIMGTLGYMAPEQVLCQQVTAATDLFSLACVIYELISGRRVFKGPTPASTMLAIMNDEPIWSQEWTDKGVPTDLVRWLSHCLEKDPRRRPQSARDVALILRDLLGAKSGGGRHAEARTSREIHSLAVLPFVTSSSSPDAEYLADGITDSLINNLAQLQHLRVVARSTVFRHRGKDIDPIQVAHDLDVQAVLTGKIFQRGEILVIAAELADVRDGSQIWGQQYKRQLTDIFALEEELSSEISGRLRAELTARDRAALLPRYTENPEAYQLYLRGRHAWNKRTVEGMRQARRYFDEAIENDPGYARAHTGLADCIQMLGIYGDIDSRQAQTRARAAQDSALRIDSSLGEALASVGFRLLMFDWKWTEAEQAFRRAIELNPGYAPAHQWLGFVLGMTARFEEAEQSLKVAQELDPFSASINTSAVWPKLWARRGGEARPGFRAAVELHPGYWVAHHYFALSCVLEGDWSNAVLSARQAVELGDSPWKFAGAGFVYGKAGLIPEAMAILDRIEEEVSRRQRPGASFYAAAVHAGLGNKDRALALLRQAAAERHWNIAWLNVDVFWDDIRSDPEFQRLQAETIGGHSMS